MPAATSVKAATPISALASMVPNNNITAVQSGPYTKAQFQSTMEGSRTIKTSKEVEHLLRDYPAALELYRTGKYKVKVKCDAEVERVILVEKRISKVAANNPTTTTTDENQENNQTVPDISINMEQEKEVKATRESRRSRSRTHSRDRVAPTTSVSNGGNIVHTTISSIRMTSNTQPKVDHHRTPSREREVSVTPQQKQHVHPRSHSRDSRNMALYHKQQGNQINREYPKKMAPFVQNVSHSGNVWGQQRPQQPYFSNPLLQQQQQQQRPNFYRPSTFIPQQNPLYQQPQQQPYYYGQHPSVPVGYQPQSIYQTPSAQTLGKTTTTIYSTNNFSSSSRSALNNAGLPPSFRTFHSNQQPISAFHPMHRSQQVPFPMNYPWPSTVKNEPVGVMMNNNNNNGVHVEQQQQQQQQQQRGARNRARSVDPGPRNQQPIRLFNPQQQQQQQQPVSALEYHQRHRPHPTNNVGPSVENAKEQNAPSKEPTNCEKLTVRQLNETFLKADPSGRVPYSSIPTLIQRFGMTLTDSDVFSAAKDLEYNVNEPISARRLIHILVKLGKITKSTQQQPQQRSAGSPSMLPEDREVTDIMTQRKAAATHVHSSNQPNQWP